MAERATSSPRRPPYEERIELEAERSAAGEGIQLEDARGLVRLAAGAWLRTAGWTLGTGARLARAALNGDSVPAVLADSAAAARELAWRLLAAADMDERLRGIVPDGVIRGRDDAEYDEPKRRPMTLRERGEELLRQSADVRYEEAAHPAYERILCELAPDEGRILRFLAIEGPQPSVDVRVGKALGVIGSQLVAPGLSMIGAQAGCRYGDRVPAYLNNLFRLGLIWFSRDQLPDPAPYQVLEAQPDVLEAIRRTGRARVVRRSIQLTPFGGHFCHYCLPLEAGAITGEFAAVVEHPPETGGQPGSAPSVVPD